MRAAPAYQLSLQRFGVWQGAVWVLATLVVATMAAWLILRESALTSPTSLAAALAAALIVALGASLVKTPAIDLRWDGRAWHLGPPAGEPVSGDLIVLIDLGPWMLLRFTPAAANARPRSIWLPVQRRGLESQWHALRCAVYSPRTAAAEDPPVAF